MRQLPWHSRWGGAALMMVSALAGGCGWLGVDLFSAGARGRDAGPQVASVQVDGGKDAAVEAVADAGSVVSAPDSGTGGAGAQVPADAATDAGQDAGLIATGEDAGQDGGPDATTDAGQDGGPDAATDAGQDAGPATEDDSCEHIFALSAPPVIDGVLDPGPVLKHITAVEWRSATPIPPDHDAHIAVGWSAGGLYVFLDIDDDSRLPAEPGEATWCGDGVELYFDADGTFAAPPAYDSPGTAQIVVSAPVDGVTDSTRAEVFADQTLQGVWGSAQFVAHPRPGGYTVEALLQGPDVGVAPLSLAAGQRVGYNVSINVSNSSMINTECGWRLSQYFLRVGEPGPLFPFNDTGGFCTPLLR